MDGVFLQLTHHSLCKFCGQQDLFTQCVVRQFLNSNKARYKVTRRTT